MDAEKMPRTTETGDFRMFCRIFSFSVDTSYLLLYFKTEQGFYHYTMGSYSFSNEERKDAIFLIMINVKSTIFMVIIAPFLMDFLNLQRNIFF